MSKTKWKDSFVQKGYELAKEGLIDIQIAKKLGIGETTFYEYQEKHPKFTEAIKIGKVESDQEIVESMRKKAKGFFEEETTTEMKLNEDGTAGQVTSIKKTKKYYPPDTGAGAFWLKNRQPKEWRDVRQIEGNLGGSVVIMVDEATKDTLNGISELGTKSPKDTDD